MARRDEQDDYHDSSDDEYHKDQDHEPEELGGNESSPIYLDVERVSKYVQIAFFMVALINASRYGLWMIRWREPNTTYYENGYLGDKDKYFNWW